MTNIAPELISINTPQKISFSQLQRAQRCTFSGVSPANLKLSEALPVERLDRFQLIGLLLHSILEAIAKASAQFTREDFDRIFRQSIEEMAARSVFKPSELETWPQVSSMYKLLYDKACTPIERRGNSKISRIIEKTFNSKDGILTGRIDLLLVKDNLPWILTEFKSSPCSEGEEIRSDYIQQLHFYSELIKEELGKYPLNLQLVHQGERQLNIPHEVALSQKINYEAHMALDLLNFRLRKGLECRGIFNLSSKSCGRCPHQLYCPEFRKLAGSVDLQGPSHIAWGLSQSKPSEREKSKSIRLQVLQGSLPFEETTILDFDVDHFPEYGKDFQEEIVITNLYYDNQYKVARMSSTSQVLLWRRRAL